MRVGESGPQQCSVWCSVVSAVSPARKGPFCCSSSSHHQQHGCYVQCPSVTFTSCFQCVKHTHQIPPFCPVNDNKADLTWLNCCVLVLSCSSGSRQPSHQHQEAADRPLPRRLLVSLRLNPKSHRDKVIITASKSVSVKRLTGTFPAFHGGVQQQLRYSFISVLDSPVCLLHSLFV